MASAPRAPIITFRAGICEADFSTKPPKIKPSPNPGFLYLYDEDDLIHFCWRQRSASLASPDLDLVCVPGDCTFVSFRKVPRGRIVVLKFSSSAQRHFFWLQSAPADGGKFTQRDDRIIDFVNTLLQGEDWDETELRAIRTAKGPSDYNDDGDAGAGSASRDTEMPDITPSAGENAATEGDASNAGAPSQGGGADGGSAPEDPNELIRRLISGIGASASGQQQPSQQQQQQQDPYTTLADLLPPATTVDAITSLSEPTLDRLISHLPETLVQAYIAQQSDTTSDASQHTSASSLSTGQKKQLLERILRSPQFAQSTGSITHALRDGGLAGVSEALGVQPDTSKATSRVAREAGYVEGGEAVQAFVEGVRKMVTKEQQDEASRHQGSGS